MPPRNRSSITDVCRLPAQSMGYGTPPAAFSSDAKFPAPCAQQTTTISPGRRTGSDEKVADVRELVPSRSSGRPDTHRRARPRADAAAHAQVRIDAGNERRPAAVALDHRDRAIGAIECALKASHADLFVHGRGARSAACRARRAAAGRARPTAIAIAMSAVCRPPMDLHDRDPESEEEIRRHLRRQEQRIGLRRHRHGPRHGREDQRANQRPTSSARAAAGAAAPAASRGARRRPPLPAECRCARTG